MTGPALLRDGEKLYLTDGGETYRVLDTVFRDRKHQIVPLGDRRASSRIFRPKEGARRLHRFKAGEDRRPELERLAQQLRGAEYLPTQREHQPVSDPR